MEIWLAFPVDGDEVIETVAVEQVGSHRYRLEAAPLFLEDIAHHDVIHASPRTDGTFEFRGIIERSGWSRHDYLLNEAQIEALTDCLAGVERVGGYFERVMGGLLLIHLPPDTATDTIAAIDARLTHTPGSAGPKHAA